MDREYILLNMNRHSNQRNSNQNFPSMNVSCSWESLSNKIAVARLQSSSLTLKHWNIASIKTTHAAKILWIVLSWICNMTRPWHHYGRHFYTQPWLIKVHLFCQWPKSHCSYLLGIRWSSKHSSDILNFSTSKPFSTEVLMAFSSDIFRRKSLT